MAVLDGSQSPDGTELEAEIAVVGAGPLGITTALELADAGHRVLLIESGGSGLDAATQHLGDTTGHDPRHAPMAQATRRRIGGASNLWGGRCVPFDPIDFEPRELVRGLGWPVTFEELAPFFQRACEWCVCGDAKFEARQIPVLASRSIVPGFVDGAVHASSLERWSLPTNFGHEYGARLRRSRNLTLVKGLTCTEIVCTDSGRGVSHLKAQALGGQVTTVRASKYVISCGGLETTRLLFASNRAHRNGIGNHSGHLGRWYMAHVATRVAEVHFTTPATETIYGHERDEDGVYVRRRFTFSPGLQKERNLPNIALWLVNPKLADASHESGILSFVYLMLISPLGRYFIAEGIRQAHIETTGPVSISSHVRNVLRHPLSAARFALTFGYQRFLRRGRRVPGFFVSSASNVYPLQYHGEHLPSDESYVRPSTELDEVGMPRLETHLHFDEEDVAAVRRAHECLGEALREQGLGRVEFVVDDVEAAVRKQLSGGFHQAGTTRMSKRPEDGVVDEHLAIHGFDDLFIASCSTFVTSGQANSTFMGIVLALRLADRLHGALSGAATAMSVESS